jgi:hypothetical protein
VQAAFNLDLEALAAGLGMHHDAMNQPPHGFHQFGPFGGLIVFQRKSLKIQSDETKIRAARAALKLTVEIEGSGKTKEQIRNPF